MKAMNRATFFTINHARGRYTYPICILIIYRPPANKMFLLYDKIGLIICDGGIKMPAKLLKNEDAPRHENLIILRV